nr:hypothetical protein [Tanacetum cinerariifolium]
MERLENAIFKQREEINDRMTEMFGLLRNSQPARLLKRGKKNASDKATSNDSIKRPDGSNAEVPLNEVKKENEAENGIKNEQIKSAEKKLTQVKEEESAKAPSTQPVGYYLKHIINEKLIEELVENHRFNNSLLAAQVGNVRN